MKNWFLPLLIVVAALGFLASIIAKQECLGAALMSMYLPHF